MNEEDFDKDVAEVEKEVNGRQKKEEQEEQARCKKEAESAEGEEAEVEAEEDEKVEEKEVRGREKMVWPLKKNYAKAISLDKVGATWSLERCVQWRSRGRY